MANEIRCFADIKTRAFGTAIRKRFKKRIDVRNRSSGDRIQTRLLPHPRAIWFWELRRQESPSWIEIGGIGYAIALTSKGGEYELPFGASELVLAKSPDKLAERIGTLITQLEKSAEQRIVLARVVTKKEIEVHFLDGQVFSLALDSQHDWTQVRIAPDHRYLIVPTTGGELDTIPWDAIRRPESHLDEESRTQRRLAQTLCTLRKEAGLSQEKAARASGLTRQTIIRLERAGNYPGLRTLGVLARAYGLDVGALLARVGSSQ